MAAVVFKGIAFPFQIGETSFPKEATNDDLIKQSLIQIIMSAPGERYMRSSFGCKSLSYVFENDNERFHARIKREVSTAIARSEPRVLVQGIDIVTNDESEVIITINYIIVATGKEDQLQVTLG